MFVEQIREHFGEKTFMTLGAHSTKAGMIHSLFYKPALYLDK
jgi:hypothetical protein